MKNLTIISVLLLGIMGVGAKVFAQNPGDIIINEVMYDPKDENEEWIELFNTTDNAIDVSGWIITDDDSYPSLSGEGKLTLPSGTIIAAGGYIVVCENSIPEIDGEVVCSQSGSYSLGNTGDNLALYTAATDGTLIDGSLTVNFPDEAADGEANEKIDPSLGWTGNGDDWAPSTNNFGATNHVYCTPGSANSVWETIPPSDVNNFTASNPTANSIDLSWNNPTDTDFTGTLILRKKGSPPTGVPNPHVTYSKGNMIGDGTIIYIGAGESVKDTGLNSNCTYYYKAFSYDEVRNYATGVLANESTIPVELTSFTISFFEGEVILKWTTQSETENFGFHIYRSLSEKEDYVKITSELIPGAGSSSESHHYFYIDRHIQAGTTYYYKLAAINLDGNIAFKGPVVITTSIPPSEYSLTQNYPNPFNPITNINFVLKQDGKVTLKIYNLQGQLVRILMDAEKFCGRYCVPWNGTDDAGACLPSGIYYYRLKINDFEETKKLTLIR